MIVDLRSDTVTKPSKEMLEAMMMAEVGDDVFEEDPTIDALERYASEMFGMEAALFCPSGTMTNQIAIKVHTSSPGELICDQLSHVYQYEGGGIAFNSGISAALLSGDRGRINADMVLKAINPDDVHKAPTQLVTIENTCNKGGGSTYDIEEIIALRNLCNEHQLGFHLDGARLFNALIARNQSADEFGKQMHSISICLSKGLGAPVGSLLLGSEGFIRKARRIRKIFGGGMRQAGYIAAAGLFALKHNIQRLEEDHQLAQKMKAMVEQQSYVVRVLDVETNILVFELTPELSVDSFLNQLSQHNVKAVPFGGNLIRFVTHLDVNENCLNQLEDALGKIKIGS